MEKNELNLESKICICEPNINMFKCCNKSIITKPAKNEFNNIVKKAITLNSCIENKFMNFTETRVKITKIMINWSKFNPFRMDIISSLYNSIILKPS